MSKQLKPVQSIKNDCESCWDCKWVDHEPWCTHPDQSITISAEDVDVRGMTAADCKGFTPIED